MTEELKQAEPKKMGWFRKYVLMQDLREIDSSMVWFLSTMFMGTTFIIALVVVIVNLSRSWIYLDKLVVYSGILHSYTHTAKSGKVGEQIIGEWYVESNGQRINYNHKFIQLDKNEMSIINKLNGESVEVRYLPANNKFYVIKFNNLNVIIPLKAKRTLIEVKHIQTHNFFVMPIYALFSMVFFMLVQMLIIRYEIMPNLDRYFFNLRIKPWFNSTSRNLFFFISPMMYGVLNLLIIVNYFVWE